jgi:hypothetical protein
MGGGGTGGGGTGGGGTSAMGGSSACQTARAGGYATAGSVSKLVSTIDKLVVSVQRAEPMSSMGGPTDQWTVDVATRATTLNFATPVTATVAQIQALVSAVASSAYRTNPRCCGDYLNIDGVPSPPSIQASSGGNEHSFGVSEKNCAPTDHSYTGDVLSCAQFASIYALLEAIAPTGLAFACNNVW